MFVFFALQSNCMLDFSLLTKAIVCVCLRIVWFCAISVWLFMMLVRQLKLVYDRIGYVGLFKSKVLNIGHCLL